MYGMFSSGRSAGVLPAFLNLRFAADLAFLFVQSERQNGWLEALHFSGQAGATKERCGVREISVGARHAVPGERTWQDRAIRRDAEIQMRPQDICSDVVGWMARDLLVARSGTACRAPTVGNGEGEQNGVEFAIV
jgi:hypothetical protein